ncbi:MAG: TolB family protein, partial [Acidobacteriota bacterium]
SNWLARWHPRRAGFAFLSMRKGDFDTYWKALEAVEPERPLLAGDADEQPYGWSPDGGQLVFTESQPDGSYPLKIVSIDEAGEAGDDSGIIIPDEVSTASVSHDGRWLAFAPESSGGEVYVQPFPGPGPRVRVSRDGGSSPCWSPDDRQLFFIHADEVIALTFRIQDGRFMPEAERVVLKAPLLSHYRSLATPDGKRFLALVPSADPQPAHLRVVLNWSDEIARRSPARR